MSRRVDIEDEMSQVQVFALAAQRQIICILIHYINLSTFFAHVKAFTIVID